MMSSLRARFSCPGFGIEIPMKEMNIQKSDRRGSGRWGSAGLGLGATGSTGQTITREKRFDFGVLLGAPGWRAPENIR